MMCFSVSELKNYFVLLMIFFVSFNTKGFSRDVHSDTWVAVDELGRSVANQQTAGDVRQEKYVGIFYYIWLKENSGADIHDINKIISGDDSWGGAPSFHHWGESLYGYYSSKDTYVIRKHMQMLSDAGVDFIFFDNTNGIIYQETQEVILNTLKTMKSEGYNIPEVSWAMYNGDVTSEVENLHDNIASDPGYQDLFFEWNGKPLLLGYYNGDRDEVADFFTFRKSWAWSSQPWYQETGGRERWPWLDNYPQQPGLDGNGDVEQITVAAAQHPHGEYAIGKSTGRDRTSPPDYGVDGRYFSIQWERAHEVDPPLIMVTQWNEWIAQRFIKDDPEYDQPVDYMAREPITSGESIFIDVYNSEYSRDIEPLRTDYRDNMYLQMVDNIRKYKGVREIRKAANPVSVKINSDFSQWSNVGPEYLDHIHDVATRDHVSYGSDYTYNNNTGRNDLDTMKVSFDESNLYFYAETRADLTPHTDSGWMYLLINSDCDYSTGWHGYDYIVNHTVNSSASTTLKSHTGSGFNWENEQELSYYYAGKQIHVEIPAAAIGLETSSPFQLDFKWVDNSLQSEDIIDLYVNGDAAPNSRFNYRFVSDGSVSVEEYYVGNENIADRISRKIDCSVNTKANPFVKLTLPYKTSVQPEIMVYNTKGKRVCLGHMQITSKKNGKTQYEKELEYLSSGVYYSVIKINGSNRITKSICIVGRGE